jgi:hypothetical protein
MLVGRFDGLEGLPPEGTMGLTAAEFADLMPDATQLESNEPEMESSQHYWQL